jgi:metallo-beta-lactamase family protein
MIEISFLGAAGTVTGSMHRVRTAKSTILLDCGLFQGRRAEAFERNRHLPVRANDVTAVVLSHAHIDHSGALPVLVKNGYRGTIFATPATVDLCSAMLEDAARIQMSDAAHIRKRIEREGSDMEPVEPLYQVSDVEKAMERFTEVPYHRVHRIAEDVTLTFLDAGHVLGSAICVLDVDDEGTPCRIVFSGDLGRVGGAILRDPEVPDGANVLILESTYGNRVHPSLEEMDVALGALVRRVHARGGKLIVPTFALERAQEVLVALHRLTDAGEIPRQPIWVDSPLTVKLTQVFRRHMECFDDETKARFAGDSSPFDFPEVRFNDSVEGSKQISRSDEPCIVLSASGMCEGGRVLHHLTATIEDPKNAIAIVGFMAQHTLGRRLVEKRPIVRIFGRELERLAEVETLNGMSAHADRNGLVAFAEACRARGKLRHVALVHGEPASSGALADALRDRDFPEVLVPERGDAISV